MSKSLPIFEHGQRVSLPDLQEFSLSLIRALSQLGAHLIDPDSIGYVLTGWTVTVADTVITINRGSGLAGLQFLGETLSGLVVSGGDPSRQIDIGSFADGEYSVYVRLELERGAFESRPFWDPVATPSPAEVSRTTATRAIENWAAVAATVSPGDEWMRLAVVTKTGSSLTVSDRRQFLYDLAGDGGFSWPTSSDSRDLERTDVNRIRGLGEFCQFVIAQLAAIIGADVDEPLNPFRSISNDQTTGSYRSLSALLRLLLSVESRVSRFEDSEPIFWNASHLPRVFSDNTIGRADIPWRQGFFGSLTADNTPVATVFLLLDNGSLTAEGYNISSASLDTVDDVISFALEEAIPTKIIGGKNSAIVLVTGADEELNGTQGVNWHGIRVDSNSYRIWGTVDHSANRIDLNNLEARLSVVVYSIP